MLLQALRIHGRGWFLHLGLRHTTSLDWRWPRSQTFQWPGNRGMEDFYSRRGHFSVSMPPGAPCTQKFQKRRSPYQVPAALPLRSKICQRGVHVWDQQEVDQRHWHQGMQRFNFQCPYCFAALGFGMDSQCKLHESPCWLHLHHEHFRTWKWMVGIELFPFGMGYLQGRTVSFSEVKCPLKINSKALSLRC